MPTVDDVDAVDGNEKAITVARAGLARAGATRAGYIPESTSTGLDKWQRSYSPNTPTVWEDREDPA